MTRLLVLTLCLAFLGACQNKASLKGRPLQPSVYDKSKEGCLDENQSPGIVGGGVLSASDPLTTRVALIMTKANNQIFACTATPITSTALLTAAHCLENVKDKDVHVFFHQDLFCQSGFNGPSQMISSKKVIVHPKYNPKIMGKNDLGLVLLANPIPSEYEITPVYVGDKVTSGVLTLMGYGATTETDQSYPRLRSTTKNFSSQVQLDQDGLVEVDQTDGHGVCTGDSGGPMLVTVGGVTQIYAVNSVVEDGKDTAHYCHGRGYGIYLPPFADWIKSQLPATDDQ